MNIEQLKKRWHENYDVDPEAKLDTELRVHLYEEDDGVIAYIGTENGWEDKKVVTDTKDIIELFKQFIEHDF